MRATCLAGAIGDTLRLEVRGAEAFPVHAAQIERIDRARWTAVIETTGLRQAGEPVLLVLAAETSPAAQAAPRWIAGYAIAQRNAAVLFPERTPVYPDANFEEVVVHEVAHVLIARAAGRGELPRWFNEGLAIYISRPWRFTDHTRVTRALLSRHRATLHDLDAGFYRDRATATHAYALAAAFVHDLLRVRGEAAATHILERVRAGDPFAVAFETVTSTSLSAAETDFWRRHTWLYRWIPILTSSATLWMVVTLLALIAIRRRHSRDAELRQRWEAEDEAGEFAPREGGVEN